MAALRLLAGATNATRAISVSAQTFYDHQPLQRSHRGARRMHESRESAGSHALDVECEDDMHVDYPGAHAVPLGTATGVSAKLTWDSGLVSNVWLCMIASSVCCCSPLCSLDVPYVDNMRSSGWFCAENCQRGGPPGRISLRIYTNRIPFQLGSTYLAVRGMLLKQFLGGAVTDHTLFHWGTYKCMLFL